MSEQKTMAAVVCHGPKDYRLEEVPIPDRGPGEALIEVEAVGICASDLKCFNGAVKFWGDATRPAWAETNVIPGHEFVGVVAEIDDAASRRWGVEVGDRVVSEQIVPCWQCRYCRRGQYWMCATHNIYGFKRATPGGMASHMVFPVEALVHTVSKDLPPAHAAFTEPLACSLHAVERAGISFDDVVVVAGCGPIGLGMIAGAAAKSPANVVALDVSADRLEVAHRCGATETVNVATDDPRELVMELTDGYGADV
jgi:erythritol/L-threitol dehydrogenase